MNIDYSDTAIELKGRIDLVANDAADAADLIYAAARAVDTNATAILAQPLSVHMLWGWLEGKRIEIFAEIGSRESGVGSRNQSPLWESRRAESEPVRGYDSRPGPGVPAQSKIAWGGPSRGGKPPTPDSRFIEEINSVLKKGADGVVIKAKKESLSDLVSAIGPVRHDLFFGKKLLFELDLENIAPLDWSDVFLNCKKIKADGIVMSAHADMTKEKGKGKREYEFDAAGAIFGMLSNWDEGFKGDLWFEFDSIANIESAFRLVKKIHPNLVDRTRFFIKEKGTRKKEQDI